jgi:hypothetical protein
MRRLKKPKQNTLHGRREQVDRGFGELSSPDV